VLFIRLRLIGLLLGVLILATVAPSLLCISCDSCRRLRAPRLSFPISIEFFKGQLKVYSFVPGLHSLFLHTHRAVDVMQLEI